MQWQYFTMVLVTEEGDVYKLVDEQGQALKENGRVVLFANFDEAETYLVEHNIRGTVR